jgi:hypothetical protein
MPPFRSPVILENIGSVRATATSFENRTFEDIDENGIFPGSTENAEEEDIDENGIFPASQIEEETEIEEENV